MHKSFIGIKNSAETKTLDLHFTDFIYDGFNWETWERQNLVQDTIDKIKEAKPDTINVVINSLGGDVMVGLGLYNYLKGHSATKNVEVIGFAASIASVIACCASPGKLRMAKSSFMIIHQAWSYASGNATDLRTQAETLEKISNQIAGVYAERSGKEASHFTNLWAEGDYWMTAEEAKEMGIADEITNTTAKANAAISEFPFKNVPKQFKPVNSADPAKQSPIDEVRSFFTSIKNDLMSLATTLQNSITGAKADVKNKDIPARDVVLDMVEAALKPVLDEMETRIANLTPKAEEEKPAEEKKVETKKEETKPVEKTEEEKPDAKVVALEAELAKVKAQIANEKLQPKDSGKNDKKKGLSASFSAVMADEDGY